MKVWLLDNGSIVLEHTQQMWNVPGPQVRVPVYNVLVEHDEGLFLFDTGMGLDHMNRVLPFELPEQTPEQTIPGQLQACGFELADVGTVVNSHLHIDHCGGNQLFAGTGARHVIHAKELAQARNHEPFEHFGYSDHSWDYDGANLVPVTGDVELAPGLWLFETPGHTAGHYSLLVGEKLLFAFDVSFTPAALEREIQSGFHNDPVAGVRSIRRVKALAADHGADVFFSHDMDAWQGYKHAPDHYEL
ncbi:MAG TPA: N-acyl homoserine lactonase family protein [Gaiellaceae bacterium]|nr:N-acyl homoserine lactonase family protein [Gaiellaceae bacterium]